MKFYSLIAAVLLFAAFLIPLSFTGTPLPFANAAAAPAASPRDGQAAAAATMPSPSQPPFPYYEGEKAGDVLRVLDKGSGKVLTVSWQEYIRGAVCAEMPPSFHPEALKAQAVAAHTFALYNRLHQQDSPDPALKGADIAADVSAFAGFITEKQARERFGEQFDLYWNKICKAADAVQNYILVYEDEPIVAAYHSVSTGFTEDASNVWSGWAPYLRPVESAGDILSPGFESTVAFTTAAARERLLAQYPQMKLEGKPEAWFGEIERSDSGYVTAIQAGGEKLHGKDIRRVFELRSTAFTMEFTADSIRFIVTGYGHGVGLSQYGADYMARQGSSFDEILTHYYSGTRLAVVR